MKICLNGQEVDVACTTLAELWRREQAERELETARGFAIARNGAVVRKSAWETTHLAPGDRIDIVRAMSGG